MQDFILTLETNKIRNWSPCLYYSIFKTVRGLLLWWHILPTTVQSIISYKTALKKIKIKKSKREACRTEQWSVTDHTCSQTACLQPGGVLATGKWPHPSVRVPECKEVGVGVQEEPTSSTISLHLEIINSHAVLWPHHTAPHSES